MFMTYEGPKMRVKLYGEARGVCPITEGRDLYKWRIDYIPRDHLLEAVELREELEKIEDNDQTITCEGLAVFLNNIVKAADPYQSTVKVWDNSAGVKIMVEI